MASIDAWRQRYGQPLAVYRTSKSHATQQGALASLLRPAETQAASITCRPYEAKAFRAALQAIRPLSCEADTTVFVQQLQALAGAAGVAVVFVPAPPGCRVSGATQWLSPDRALIALSLRHKPTITFGSRCSMRLATSTNMARRPRLWMASMVCLGMELEFAEVRKLPQR